MVSNAFLWNSNSICQILTKLRAAYPFGNVTSQQPVMNNITVFLVFIKVFFFITLQCSSMKWQMIIKMTQIDLVVFETFRTNCPVLFNGTTIWSLHIKTQKWRKFIWDSYAITGGKCNRRCYSNIGFLYFFVFLKILCRHI